MPLTVNRLDASQFTEEERGRLQPLIELAERNEHFSLKGSDGTEVPLPEPIQQLLLSVLTNMRDDRALVVSPEDEALTSQDAADFLGVSRQYLVTLLDEGKIPHHKVGTHRRVYFKDLRAYAKIRDEERRSGLNRLFMEVNAAGKYDGRK